MRPLGQVVLPLVICPFKRHLEGRLEVPAGKLCRIPLNRRLAPRRLLPVEPQTRSGKTHSDKTTFRAIAYVRILAIETSGMAGSVAALEDNRLIAELTLAPQQRSARSLAPGMKGLIEQALWQPRDVQLVAVAVGPGSFTGLRVGVTTAKTFAYAVSAEVLGVNTLAAVAENSPADVQRLSCVIDAQRGQFYTAEFVRDAAGLLVPACETHIIDRDAWLAQTGECTEPIAVSGPAIRQLAAGIPPSVHILAEQHWTPTAAAVGRLAARSYAAGLRDDLWKLVPNYYRRSAAEEKRGDGA